MAAPTTKLLFLFLLGITSWSRYVAANKVTLTGCNVNVADGNGVIDSMECSIEDNKLKSNINVKGCPGVPQLGLELLKDGQLVTSGGKSIKEPKGELGNMCTYVDGPDPGDDSCSMAEGGYEISGCDIEPYISDNNPGDYQINIEIQIDGTVLSTMDMQVTIDSE